MLGAQNPFIHESGGKTRKDVITDLLQTVVLALAFSLVLYLVFLVPSIVDGPSMQPNFYDNELLFANKTIQWLGPTSLGDRLNYDYKRGDVIIFAHADDNLIKRIIATQGDTVRITGGEVYVNGKLIEEKYLPESYYTRVPDRNRSLLDEGEVVRVPENSYFVMGDNRSVSKDSRYAEVGFVDRSQIRGKVFFRYWPINQLGIIGTGEYEEITVESSI